MGKNFQRKRTWRDVLQSFPVLIFLTLFLLFFAWGVWGLLGKMQVTKENKKLMEDKIANLTKQKEELAEDIDQLKTIEGQEASIRNKFGLAKEGEGLIIVVDDKATVEAENKKSHWYSFLMFWNWFD